MKRKIVLSLLCSLMLVGCNNAKTPTYTITIQSVDHFNVDKSSYTFEENDFSTVTFNYTTETGYVIYGVESDVDTATTDFNLEKQTITVTPKENANINVTIDITKITDVHTIEIICKDDHFTPDKRYVNFIKGKRTPIEVPYTIDDYYEADSFVISPEGAGTCVRSYPKLIITPQEDVDFTVTVNLIRQSKNIHFNAGSGEVEGFDDKTVNYGTMWGEITDRPTAKYRSYDFIGWSFTSGDHGEIIPNYYVVDSSTHSEVYAVYQHHINFVDPEGNSTSLKVERIDYVDDKINIHLIINDTSKYVMPANKNLIQVKSNNHVIGFTYSRISDVQSLITVTNDEDVETGAIDIISSDQQPSFNFVPDFDKKTDHLDFQYDNYPQKGENFVIKLNAVNDTSNESIYYYVPDKIDVWVKMNDDYYTKLSPSAYKIDYVDTDKQEANVTVFGRYVKNDIKISATAMFTEGYYYEFNGYGVEVAEIEPNDQDTTTVSGYKNKGEGVNIELRGSYIQSITTDNFVIKAKTNDVETWYSYEKFSSTYPGVVVYNIEENSVKINPFAQDLSSIVVHIFNPTYSVFKNASWNEIYELASLPSEIVDRMFDIGETRDLTLANNLTYQLRIIDFNHDKISGEDKNASLTVEFVQLVTNDDGSLYTGRYGDFDGRLAEYENRDYDSYLNNIFLNSLPSDLLSVIKKVNKSYYYQNLYSKTLEREIFAFSMKEINLKDTLYDHNEGSTYEYYNNHPEARKKTYVGGDLSSPSHYWTRSHAQVKEWLSDAYRVNQKGDCHEDRFDAKVGYMAAFCI